MAEENFKPKHLVLDQNANELFEQAFIKSEALTQKAAISIILATYLKNPKEIDLTNLHNPIDVQEIQQLKEVKCDKINCTLITELNKVNTDLNLINDDLTTFNTKLSTELTTLQKELNVSTDSIKNMDLDGRLSPLQKIALNMVAKNESVKRGKSIDALQVLVNMFTDHVFKHQIQFFEKPNSVDVQHMYKEVTNV